MYKLFFCVLFAVVYGQSEPAIGPGVWNILSIKKYEGDENDNFYLDYDIVKRRLNRTHEGYNISCNFQEDVDNSNGLQVDVCKKVDGGCKLYQVLTDDSFEHFMQLHAKLTLEKLLTAAGLDPPSFPIPKGKYVIENFVIDFCDLPPNGPYGAFEALACILKVSKDRAMCLVANVEFVKDEDNSCGRDE